LAHEQAGNLTEARELFSRCAATTCGKAVKKQCASRFAQLTAEIPSIIPALLDDARTDVQVNLDGDLLTSHLDGRALSVDPGVHDVTFSAEGTVFATRRFTIARGERGRRIAVARRGSEKGAQATAAETKTKPPAAEEPPQEEAAEPEREQGAESASSESQKPGAPALAYVLGGVGLAGVGTGILLNVWGRGDNTELQTNCMPNCPESSVAHVRRLYFAADVSIGVGVAALGVSTVLFLLPRHSKENPETRSAYTFDVTPTPSGGFATISGKF
jgi:hypothetical protein